VAKAYATDSDLLARYPELVAASGPLRAEALAEARTSVNLGTWGSKAMFGHRALAAHLIATTPGVSIPGVGPNVVSRRIGELQVTYGGSTPTEDGALASTPYGKHYLRLRDSIVVLPIVGGML
jgi:hypothetical protein